MISKIYPGWSKKEVVQLTGLSIKKLDYLDKLGFLIPMRIGSDLKPVVRYSWEQLVALRAYAEMRKHCSLQALREALDYLQLEDPISHIAKKQLVAFGNTVYWIHDDPSTLAEIVSFSNRGNIDFIIKGNLLLEKLWENGENKIVNFETRAKEKPCSKISA